MRVLVSVVLKTTGLTKEDREPRTTSEKSALENRAYATSTA
jgi:hypothetical protein